MAFEWNFEPRDVRFSLTLRATFHPSIGDAVVTVPWLDATGKPSTAVTIGPLSSLEEDTAPRASEGSPKRGASSVCASQDLGSFQVTQAFVEGLRSATLLTTIKLQPSGTDLPARATCLHLGPLLVSPGSHGLIADKQTPSLGRTTRFPSCKVSSSCTGLAGIAGLYFLELQVSTSMPVLSKAMLDRLMPACFLVEEVRGLPNETWLPRDCEDVFVEVYPKVSSTTVCLAEACPKLRSAAWPHNSVVRFFEPVVWFLGLAPQHAVREWLQHGGLVVEVHDRDLKSNADAVHPHGVASFALAPLLEPIALELPLSADVFPARGDKKPRRAKAMKGEALGADGLLDEEGQAKIARRAGLDKREDTTDYHTGTVCSIRAVLAVPVPKASAIQESEEFATSQRWGASEVKQEDANVWVTTVTRSSQVAGHPPRSPRNAPSRAKLLLGAQEILGPWRTSVDDAKEDESKLAAAAAAAETAAKGESVDPAVVASSQLAGVEAAQALAAQLVSQAAAIDRRFERFNRVVYVVDESDLRSIQGILRTVKSHNAEILGLDKDSMRFKLFQLSEEEKADPHLDLLTGFAVLDSSSRVVVIEGLRGREGMKKLLEAVPRAEEEEQDPLSKIRPLRMLHNPTIGFGERLYTDFAPLVKQVKIRLPLERLAVKPDLYSWTPANSPETEAASEAPKLLMGLKQASRLQALRAGAFFPTTAHLLNLEMLYGGYMSDEELAGMPRVEKMTQKVSSKTDVLTEAVTLGMTSLRRLASGDLRRTTLPVRASLDMNNEEWFEHVEIRKSASLPNFSAQNKTAVHKKSEENVRIHDEQGKIRERDVSFLEGAVPFNYSSQRLNCTEMQKAHMRKSMDPQQTSKMWTYNESYMSNNFDFSGAEPPGIHPPKPCAPNDTYANLEGDNRPVWRMRKAQDLTKELLSINQAQEFDENEWHQLAAGDERRRPVAAEVRFEPEMIPHLRRTTDRPFDPPLCKHNPPETTPFFGPDSDFESVHYHGRAPGESRGAEVEANNLRERAAIAPFLGRRTVRTFLQISTRQCIVDLDRTEAMLKDPPAKPLQYRGRLDEPSPSSMRIYEGEFHDLGRPDKEWHARLRENDMNPSYDATTGAYLRRDPAVGTKRGCMSGTLGKAPWQHGSTGSLKVPAATLPGLTASMKTMLYPSAKDFNTTRIPPPVKFREEQVWKNTSRTSISAKERSSSVKYMRPSHYGVELSQLSS